MNTGGSSDRSFVHLHVHSHYSLGDGVASAEALVRQAAALEMPTLALTDHNTLAGMVPFLEACAEQGLDPILGCQLDVLPWRETATRSEIGSLVLLVESEIGYRNLSQLITHAHGKIRERQPAQVCHEELAEHATGLIALVGASSPIRRFLNPPDTSRIEGYLTDLVRIFGKQNLFFELLPADSNWQRSLNEYFIQLGDFLDIGIVASNDVHYVWPEDALAWQFLAGRKPPRSVGPDASELGGDRRHLASAREMRDRFAFVPRALAGSVTIAERCRFRPALRKRRLLVHDFTRGFDAESHLWDLVFRCATEKYGELDETIKSRLNEEFDYLSRHGLTNYFLLLWDLAHFLGENRIPCLVRRGAITTSLVAYVLGLTGLDPLAHGLGFDPLLEDGSVFPDVMVQSASRHMHQLLDHLEHKYGTDKIARLGHHHYWPKAELLKEICHWAGLPKQKTEALLAAKAISTRGGAQLRWADLFRGGVRSLAPDHASALSFVFSRLDPLPRDLAARDHQLLLCGQAIDEVVPLACPNGQGPATQLDAGDCDALGLPRLSLMPTRPLDILEEAISWVRRDKDRHFDITDIDDSDPETFRVFAQGRTAGIPGFEGLMLRSLLRRERPSNLEDLIRLKTKSLGGRNPAFRTPPGTVIADCRLAYRCAYVKAHYPVCYYTALLTHVCRNRWRFARVLREMAQEGIRVLPPQINASSHGFTIINDRICTGLIVVAQMGEKAAAEITSVRRGGEFHSLLDLCRRTDPKLVHHRLVENLIKAGAMDAFGWRRSQMLAMLDRIIDKPRAQPGKPPGSAVQMELFPALAAEEPDEDLEPPELPELPLNLLLQYELQAAGHTFSADLLSPFEELMSRCRIGRAPLPLSARLEGREIYLGGLILQIERATPTDPQGEGVWLDFDGMLVAVPERLHEQHGPMLRQGEPLMIGGKVVRNQNERYLRAHTIVPLMKILQQANQARRVVLDLNGENRHTLRALRQVCGQFPGPTKVDTVNCRASGLRLRKLDSCKVVVCPPLLNNLRTILEPERVRVYGYGED